MANGLLSPRSHRDQLMRRLDRYITAQFAPLLLFGTGAFLVILIGVELLPQALKMIVREGLPIPSVARVFLYQTPAMVALTLPMATMFASLMVVSSLSSHGELQALKAGGVPFVRIVAPIIIAGFAVSLLTLGFNEAVSPAASRKAFHLLKEYRERGRPAENIIFQIPDTGKPHWWFRMGSFDPKTRQADDVMVVHFRDNGTVARIFQAARADWQGEHWILEDATEIVMDELGRQRKRHADTIQVPVGKSADQFDELRQDPDEMSIAQVQRLLRQRQMLGLSYRPHQLELHQIIQTRLAMPWCALGFAILGVALGRRPMRASTGVGFGVSLVIVFLYYLAFNTLTLMGERGLLIPMFTAWTPNVILFATGLYLLYNEPG